MNRRDLLARLWRDRAGATAAITMLLLPVLLGIAGLATEYGFGLVRKAENQRVADTAAYTGALAYNATIATTDGTAAMTAAALRIAQLNAVDPADVAVALTTSPANPALPAVRVTISDQVPLVFSRLLAMNTTLPIVSRAIVEVSVDSQPCVIALQAAAGPLTAGLTLDAGTVINALLCAVSANAAITVPCTALINTARVSFNSALPPDAPCNGIQAPVGQVLRLLAKQVTDPYILDAGIVGANLRVVTTLTQSSPLPPVLLLPPNLDFTASTGPLLPFSGCSASRSGSVWTVTGCAATVNAARITVAAGTTVNFNTGGAASIHYNVGVVEVSSTGTLNFGAGEYAVGRLLPPACVDNGVTTGSVSICNRGTIRFAGPSSFSLSAGIYNGIGASATLGAGSGNNFRIGSALLGSALRAAQGSTTIFGDATTGTGIYRFTGDILMTPTSNINTANGSCLVIGAAANHDINGSLRTADTNIFGPGTYTVTGAVSLGTNGTRATSCTATVNGVSVTANGIKASGVTFVTGGGTGGLAAPLSGPCAGQSFCVAPGYQNVELTAPSTGLLARVVVVGPALNATGVLFSDGLSNTTVSGLFYAPLGPLTMSGAAAVGNGLGQCLELVAAQILVHRSLNIFAAPCKSGGPVTRSARLVD